MQINLKVLREPWMSLNCEWVAGDEDLEFSIKYLINQSKLRRWDHWRRMCKVRGEGALDRGKNDEHQYLQKKVKEPAGAAGEIGSHRRVWSQGSKGVKRGWRGWWWWMRQSHPVSKALKMVHWICSYDLTAGGNCHASSYLSFLFEYPTPGVLDYIPALRCWFFYWSLVPPLSSFCLKSAWTQIHACHQVFACDGNEFILGVHSSLQVISQQSCKKQEYFSSFNGQENWVS